MGDRAPLHLVSWNAAGWKTTLAEMARTTTGTGQKDANQLACDAWLSALQVDILCVQEAKLQSKEVSDRQRDVFAKSDRWESFWACNDGTAKSQRAGLNGVVTFAKRDGPYVVLRADPAPLGSVELDAEGRCVLTDHGAFVLFNCYVPNSASEERVAFKAKWLAALETAMRKEKKPVILAGDLNLKARGDDVHWSRRCLDASKLGDATLMDSLSSTTSSSTMDELRRGLTAWRTLWPAVRASLHDRVAEEVSTTNPTTSLKFTKWRVRASTVSSSKETRLLGGYEKTAECAMSAFDVSDHDDKGVLLCSLDLNNAFEKLADSPLSKAALEVLVDSELLAPSWCNASTRWVQGLLESGFLVDSFRECHPTARNRFTCWNQYSNQRYSNEGSRIDYVLVSKQLYEQSAPRAGDLDRGLATADRTTALSSHAATTLSGRFEPASFAGGGVPEARPEDYAHHSTRAPHTGMIYTPPSWSDHIAVSLKLDSLAVVEKPAKLDQTLRKKAQPHATTTLITSFFSKAAPGGPPAMPKKRKPEAAPAAEKKPKGIASFFGAPPAKKK